MKLNGPNASGQTHYMSLSGLEVYGEICGLADEDLGRIFHLLERMWSIACKDIDLSYSAFLTDPHAVFSLIVYQ